MIKRFLEYKFLFLIVTFGFLIRLYQIELVPPSLNWDEVSHGYNAYSLLKTGKDEWGISLPLIFRAYGDYKLPVYIYLTALSESIFGLNAFAVRLPSLLAGTLVILATYFLAVLLFKSKKMALTLAFLVAVSPWSFFLSRIALEANLSLLFVVSGVCLFVLGLQRKNLILPLAIFLLGLSVWTYNSARIFTPLIMVVVLILYREKLFQIVRSRKVLLFTSLSILLIFFVPMFLQLLSNVGRARYENIQILDQGAIGQINELRQRFNLPASLERAIFNKGTYFAASFGLNYIKYFSPQFLFLNGGDNYQFSIPGKGLVFIATAPFLLYGLWSMVRYRKNKKIKLILLWLLLSPIAGSVTREAPHVLRGIFMLVPVLAISAYGMISLENKLKTKYLSFIFILLNFFYFTDYFNIYHTEYRQNYSWVWQYGYKEAMNYARENYDNYEKIIVTKKYGEPHEFALFYFPWQPKEYLADKNLIRFNQSNWFWVDSFDKFYFVNDWQIPKEGSEFVLESGLSFYCASCLLITSPSNAPDGWRKLDEIYFLDGSIAFEIYEH